MNLPLVPVPAFDALCHERRITGYTVERCAGYLRARRPTLTYRMYRDPDGRRHATRFAIDMTRLGARTATAPAAGNLRLEDGIQRTAQVTVTAWFQDLRTLTRALGLIRRRYHAGGTRPVAGSWWLPDVRLSGCGELPGTIPAIAQSLGARQGVAVALTADGDLMVPGARLDRVRVLGEWAELLVDGRSIAA
ncbi:MAG: hypothetical protein ACREQM_06560 [Candidatus Dormibacteraceae bacterium]